MTVLSAKGLSNIKSSAFARGAILTKLSNITAISSTKVRVFFDRGMTKNTELTSKNNYIIETTAECSVVPTILSVTAESVLYPTYIDIITSEHTNNVLYNIEANPLTIIDLNEDKIDPINNNYDYYGIGVEPYVLSVKPISVNRVDVIFSENMFDNKNIRDASNYSFDNGLIVLNVLDLDGDTIKLVTSDQTPGVLYTLTVSS